MRREVARDWAHQADIQLDEQAEKKEEEQQHMAALRHLRCAPADAGPHRGADEQRREAHQHAGAHLRWAPPKAISLTIRLTHA